jgi:hypothetical protein
MSHAPCSLWAGRPRQDLSDGVRNVRCDGFSRSMKANGRGSAVRAVFYFDVPGMLHNVCVYAVAGLGGFKNAAQRNVKPDMQYIVPRDRTTF